MRKKILVNDWILSLWRPAKARSTRLTVTLDNVEAPDRAFAEVLRKLVEVWVNAARRGGRHGS